jgi:26S proteasome regulatory subunit T3
MQEDDDLYAQLKGLQRQEEFLDIQEEYIKDEMRNLKRELIRAREVCRLFYQLFLCEFMKVISLNRYLIMILFVYLFCFRN